MIERLDETLADEIKSENNKTAAARQAKKMGLTYAGFGRYLDAKGQVSYVVQNGQLVPFKGLEDVQKMYDKAENASNPEKYKQLKSQADEHSKTYKTRQKEDDKLIRNKAKEFKKTNRELNKYFAQIGFSEQQYDALADYTDTFYDSVNRYLYKGHDEGVDAKKDSDIVGVISAIDSAFEEAEAPFDYSVYTGLSSRYKADKIVPGERYLFRGYLSTSVDPTVAATGYTDETKNGRVLLQIDIQQGQKALHIDEISTKQGESETLLPRGTVLQIISGPHPIDPTILDPNMGDMQGQVVLFHCAIAEEE